MEKECLPIGGAPFAPLGAFNFLDLLALVETELHASSPHTANEQLAPQVTGASGFKDSGDRLK